MGDLFFSSHGNRISQSLYSDGITSLAIFFLSMNPMFRFAIQISKDRKEYEMGQISHDLFKCFLPVSQRQEKKGKSINIKTAWKREIHCQPLVK